jgi:hypothetical protein
VAGELRVLAGAHEVDLLSGVPTAALMRCQGGNPSPVTDRACVELLERTSREASDWLESIVERILAESGARPDRDLHDIPLLARERLVRELRG